MVHKIAFAFLAFLLLAAVEPGMSPVGRWRTIDDHTGRPKSIVEIRESNGKLSGIIESVYPQPGRPPNPVCEKCSGDLKNRPIKGMMFLWGFTRHGDGWSDGHILDPENGKVYKCTLKVENGGARMKVRGYVGVSLFGRTQVWERVS
jgi:uncharacterized protein (DUF2147 family)